MMAEDRTDFIDWLTGLSPRAILLHPAFLFMIATVLTIGAANQLWLKYQDKIVDSESYVLSPDQISVSAPPPWVSEDLRQVVMEEFQGQPSLLDTQLVSATAKRFQQVGYVQHVEQVRKSESGLEVDLVFRRPIAMVRYNNSELLPIDRFGVIMDGRAISPKQAMQFMKISVRPPHVASLSTWQQWPDSRVQRAAALTHFLSNDWRSLGLYQVVTYQRAGEVGSKLPFELWTRNRGKVIWGSAPGEEQPGEATAERKLQLIEAFVQQNGMISQFAGRSKIDVRTGSVVLVEDSRTAASFGNWLIR